LGFSSRAGPVNKEDNFFNNKKGLRNYLKIRSYRHPGGSQGSALSGMPGFRFSPE
jgi:hypothetical protein